MTATAGTGGGALHVPAWAQVNTGMSVILTRALNPVHVDLVSCSVYALACFRWVLARAASSGVNGGRPPLGSAWATSSHIVHSDRMHALRANWKQWQREARTQASEAE